MEYCHVIGSPVTWHTTQGEATWGPRCGTLPPTYFTCFTAARVSVVSIKRRTLFGASASRRDMQPLHTFRGLGFHVTDGVRRVLKNVTDQQSKSCLSWWRTGTVTPAIAKSISLSAPSRQFSGCRTSSARLVVPTFVTSVLLRVFRPRAIYIVFASTS